MLGVDKKAMDIVKNYADANGYTYEYNNDDFGHLIVDGGFDLIL